jgi:mRNA-degrading endonuclease toxin of MazEF toxin-antitoxin module
MTPGELYLAQFPFGGSVGAKVRPVLVLTGPLGSVPEFLVGYMSTVLPAPLLPTDLVLDPSQPEHAGTNLSATSVVRLHKLATIHRRSLVRPLGRVSPATWAEVEARLRILLNL